MKLSNVAYVVCGSILFLVACSCVTFVNSGHVGVVTSFGAVEKEVLSEGVNFIAPWKNCSNLSIRTSEHKEVANVPTSEGLTIKLEASLIYALNKSNVSEIYQKIGPDFIEVIISPQMRSAIRGVTVKYQAKDLYTSNRAEIEAALLEAMKHTIEPYGIMVESILLRDIDLPERVRSAIETKLSADQAAQQMEFVLLKEKKESERKVIEAQGIAEAQKTIHTTLTDNYIKYLWVKALENNAQHPSTVIYVPIGQDGLPVVANVKNGK